MKARADRHPLLVECEYPRLDSEFPDWRAIANSPDFREWYADQPYSVSKLSASWEEGDALQLLRKYREDRMSEKHWKEQMQAMQNAAAGKIGGAIAASSNNVAQQYRTDKPISENPKLLLTRKA